MAKRKIISYMMTFILMLCIICISIISMGKFSMFSQRAVFHAYDKVGFFTEICTEMQDEAYRMGIPYGIEKKNLKDVFIRKNVMSDLMDTLAADINNEKTVVNIECIRDKIKNNVEKQEGKLSSKQMESLEAYTSEVGKMYQRKVVIPGSEYIANMINKSTKLFLTVVPVCILIAILCMFYLIVSRSATYRGMRYITYSVLGAGVTLLTIFAALISNGFIYKFNISNAYMRRFYTYYIGHECLMQVFVGIGLVIFGCFLVFVIRRKKYKRKF